jgi:DNA helicase-2/ATP-dependent DNA helicase PcrA
MMEWSKYQLGVFEAVKNDLDNLLVEAVAGSGKSTVLEQCNRLLPESMAVVNTAFNKHIATALSQRLPFGREVGTMNSLGWGVYRTNVRGVNLDANKNFNYLQSHFNMDNDDDRKLFWTIQGTVCRIVSLFKALNLQSWPDNWSELTDTYGVEVGDFDPEKHAIDAWSAKVFEWSIRTLHIADFDDQIYQPLRQGWLIRRRDVAFVDEAQDLSPCQIEFVLHLGHRVISVGDRNQAIYVFRGADINAIPNIIEMTKATCLPLSICYRCPEEVIAEAKRYVPQIEAAPGARKGYVGDIKSSDFWNQVDSGDYVTCRTTAPLVSYCLKAIREKKKAFVRGRDIGKGLKDLINKIGSGLPMESFLGELNRYHQQQTARLSKSNRQSELQAVDDRVQTVQAIATECDYVSDISRAIDSIFSDDNKEGIEFSTIHKAKGREKPNVYRLRPELCPHPKTPEHLLQIENNLKYVEITRAQENLFTIVEEK